ncbi:MAG: hypothetical protein H6659_13865 [Ardenticatenaceae bacterium]|nr:hypothetical protein [Ardenticatenaceae bacterium]MCB8987833.1 hypothetical protein [Ardenticatenaceae bacterium]
MKIVIGIFEPNELNTAVKSLTENGFDIKDISLMASADDMPEFELEGKPEKSAVQGAEIGAIAGGSLGAIGSWAISAIPGFGALFAAGLMSTAIGSVVGGYLGSLYSVRAESQTKYDVEEALEEALEEDEILLAVRTPDENAETAVSFLKANRGQHVEVHTLSDEEDPGKTG